MSQVATISRMTIEEMLALPDNGYDRELIRGELREEPMTRRNRGFTTQTTATPVSR